MITTETKFTPWVVVKDKLGYLNIHEQPEECAPGTGDLIAQTYGDEQHAYRMAAANELYEALTEARTTLSILRTQVMVEIGRCPDPSESRWEGVPEKLKDRLDAIDAALAKSGAPA